MSFTLPDTFWSGFRRRFWGRQGTVLSGLRGTPLASADQVFSCLVAASRHWTGVNRSFIPEFFVEHAQLLTDVHRLLPTAADGSVKGWTARVTSLLGGRRFGFVVDDYHVHDELVWRRVHALRAASRALRQLHVRPRRPQAHPCLARRVLSRQAGPDQPARLRAVQRRVGRARRAAG